MAGGARSAEGVEVWAAMVAEVAAVVAGSFCFAATTTTTTPVMATRRRCRRPH